VHTLPTQKHSEHAATSLKELQARPGAANLVKCDNTFQGTIPQVVARWLQTTSPKDNDPKQNFALQPGNPSDLVDQADDLDDSMFIPVGTIVRPAAPVAMETDASHHHTPASTQSAPPSQSYTHVRPHPPASNDKPSHPILNNIPNLASLSNPLPSLSNQTKSQKSKANTKPTGAKPLKRKVYSKKQDDKDLKTAKKSKGVSGRMKTGGKGGGQHHPLISCKKIGGKLPQPSLEEEVVDTPMGQRSSSSHKQGGLGDDVARLSFEITSDDGFSCQGATMEEAWRQVLERVQDVRAAARMEQLSYAAISGRSMFGVDHQALVYLIEQLYGAVHCHQHYRFKFHKYHVHQADQEVPPNPTGSARSEGFTSRKPFDMFNFLKSMYRNKPQTEKEKEEEMALKSSRRATSLSLPMAMRFRKLKTFAKEAVDVYRSKIHGRGLFCKRNIDAGEMVIEYAGEVIRASLTDKREKYYESKGIGCYMFRIDDDEVVDATMHGSAARFINHSCEPSCFSKVINVEGKKHIVIFAMRPIKRGEELTYDYKFPIEDVKIPCSCGSKRCRKYLN